MRKRLRIYRTVLPVIQWYYVADHCIAELGLLHISHSGEAVFFSMYCTNIHALSPLLHQLKCGACGQIGHMRTNKECPLYHRAGPTAPVQVAMTEEQEEEEEMALPTENDLMNIDGTKIKLSKRVVEQ